MSTFLPQPALLAVGGSLAPPMPVLGFIGLHAALPQLASTMLDSLRVWMQKYCCAITVVLCIVFGAYFLIRGLSGL